MRSSQCLKFDSLGANFDGLVHIEQTLALNRALASGRSDWTHLISRWDRILSFLKKINDRTLSVFGFVCVKRKKPTRGSKRKTMKKKLKWFYDITEWHHLCHVPLPPNEKKCSVLLVLLVLGMVVIVHFWLRDRTNNKGTKKLNP